MVARDSLFFKSRPHHAWELLEQITLKWLEHHSFQQNLKASTKMVISRLRPRIKGFSLPLTIKISLSLIFYYTFITILYTVALLIRAWKNSITTSMMTMTTRSHWRWKRRLIMIHIVDPPLGNICHYNHNSFKNLTRLQHMVAYCSLSFSSEWEARESSISPPSCFLDAPTPMDCSLKYLIC